MEPRERRRHPRVEVKYRVAMSFSLGRAEGAGELLNLSEGGCAVHADKRVPDKALLQLSIQVPGRPAPVLIKNAAVRWVRGFDFGVEFVSLAPEEQEQVRALLRDLQAAIPGAAPPAAKPKP